MRVAPCELDRDWSQPFSGAGAANAKAVVLLEGGAVSRADYQLVVIGEEPVREEVERDPYVRAPVDERHHPARRRPYRRRTATIIATFPCATHLVHTTEYTLFFDPNIIFKLDKTISN